ncbi:MAG: hypothetical protein ACYTGP_09375 [Planctomycetota bacterium]|jgi:hypothetical protein
MKRITTTALVVLFLLAGCKATHNTIPEGTMTPPPFSAEAIRDANPTGTELVFRVEHPGTPATLHMMKFISTDERGAVIVSEERSLDGKRIGEPEREESTWEELRDHAAFPAHRTTRSLATREVPAGRFDCWLYQVVQEPTEEEIEELGHDPGTITNRFYFASERPGPPILFSTVHGNKPVMRAVLVRDNRDR